MRRPAPGYGFKLAASLAVAAVIVVPLAAVGTSVARRHLTLNRLASPDPVLRERALNVLIREAAHDPRWLDGVVQRLELMPGDAILPLVNAVELAQVQDTQAFHAALADQYPRLTDAVFLSVTSGVDPTDEAQTRAVIAEAIVRLRAAVDAAGREPWIALLDRCRAWKTPPVPLEVYADWLARGVEAELPALRVHTAHRLGDLPIHQPDMDGRLVADPLRRLLSDPDAAVRAAALQAIAGYALRHPDYLNDIEQATADPDPGINAWAKRLMRIATQDRASIHPMPAGHAVTPPLPLDATRDWLALLLYLDAQPSASVDITLDDTMPHHVRIAATRAAREAQPQWLLDTMRVNDRSALRDVAALTLAWRFMPDELEPFILDLLQDHDPQARLSGAVLSGLTGRAADAVEAALPRERKEAAKIVMQAALWMQGQRPELDGQIEAILGHGYDSPDSTLLLAMLHAGERRAVLDRVLSFGNSYSMSPTASDTPADVPIVFSRGPLRTERWSRVLNHYLPPTAPRLPLDGDDEAFAERLADLKAWHTLHRFE